MKELPTQIVTLDAVASRAGTDELRGMNNRQWRRWVRLTVRRQMEAVAARMGAIGVTRYRIEGGAGLAGGARCLLHAERPVTDMPAIKPPRHGEYSDAEQFIIERDLRA